MRVIHSLPLPPDARFTLYPDQETILCYRTYNGPPALRTIHPVSRETSNLTLGIATTAKDDARALFLCHGNNKHILIAI